MANATSEITASLESLQPVHNKAGLRRRILKWIVGIALAIWIFDLGISLLMNYTRLRRILNSHVAASFGRPVEVGKYNFSMWTGPELEADSVVVSDDPRFGHEYFLRAESLTIHFRWQSLLRGRLELGTLSLSHPSLNLVHDPGGDWNLYEWLPKPPPVQAIGQAKQPAPTQSAIGPVRSSLSVLRFRKIEIDAGRLNFKDGAEKLPIAFINVKGAVETESPGRYRRPAARHDPLDWPRRRHFFALASCGA